LNDNRGYGTAPASQWIAGDASDHAAIAAALRAGLEAKLSFKAHPHMPRHGLRHALANRGHDTRALQVYLGHKNIQHTVRYTELSPTRFKDFRRN
jgi:site-specific recombinase XerD